MGNPRILAAVRTKTIRVGGLLNAPSRVPKVLVDSTRILLTTHIWQWLPMGAKDILLCRLWTSLMLPPEVVLTLAMLSIELLLTFWYRLYRP